MSPSNALKQKLVSQQGRIANSKTNAIIRTRFDKVSSEISDSNKILAGKTILVKDNIAIKGEYLTCASNLLESYKSPYSATVIDRLESKGALSKGKTNMDEFAMGSSSEYSIYGSVKNPHDLTRVAGGSSGGSAAAVAEDLCDIALGSDTGGSIRQPASFCGVYGLKPTYGRISRYGLVAHASSFDTIGILSKSLTDITSTFSVMSGNDPKDATSCKEAVLSLNQYNKDKLPKNIGILSKKVLLWECNTNLKRLTFNEQYTPINQMWTLQLNIGQYAAGLSAQPFKTTKDYNDWLSRLDDYLVWLSSAEDRMREGIENGYVLPKSLTKKVIPQLKTIINTNLEENLFNSPIRQFPSTFSDPIKMYLADIFTVPFNLIGTPSLNIPAGTTKDKLPIGFQIAGNSFKEETLFNFAHSLNKAELFK